MVSTDVAATGTLTVLDEAGRALLFTEARSANTFADTPVSDEELAGIWDLAQWAPSTMNSQPLRVLFVRTPEGKSRLAPFLAEENRDKTASAPVTAILAQDNDFHEHMPIVFPDRGEGIRQGLAGHPVIREGMAGYSAALQAGIFLLAVRACGLVAGPMAGFDRTGVDEEFFAGTAWRSNLVVNIGHPGPNPWYPRLPRLPHEEALRWV